MAKQKQLLSVSISSLALSIGLAALSGCGDDVTDVTNVTETTGMKKISKYSDLPKCTSDNFGAIYYASDSAKVFYCNEKKWITLNGADGEDDVSEATGMTKVTEYSDLPKCTTNNFGALYFVSDSTKVYYCSEKKWRTLNGADGKDGKDGKDGENGKDGKDGKDGKNGKDGKDGTNGKDGETPILFDSLGNYIPGTGDSITVVIENYGKTVTGLGECTSKREGEVAHLDSIDASLYYICKSKSWRTAIPQEYDTYKWADSTDGASKLGNVTKKMYVFDKKNWRAAIGAEVELGLCLEKRAGEVAKYNGIYFTCNSRKWAPSTLLEYDTYGKDCLQNGAIDSGKIHPYNKYLCDRGKFRFAKPMELAMNQGCTSYNKGEQRRYQYSNYVCDPDSTLAYNYYGDWYVDRDSSGWSYDFDHLNTGTILDSRDGNVYKTVGIKNQLWMAENLKYAKTGSYCYHDSTKYCKSTGRVYKGSDIAKVCPEGWHVPNNIEWNLLFDQFQMDSFSNGEVVYGINFDGSPARWVEILIGRTTIRWPDYESSRDGYWSSSPSDTKGWYHYVNEGSEYPSTTDSTSWHAVRCVKNFEDEE